MGILDTAVIVVYLCVLVTMGIYFSRRQKTTEDYFLAGRNLPGWVVGFSIMGTIVGSVTFIGHPGEVFKTNMWSLPAHLAYPFVMVFVSVYIVSFYRRTIRMTAYKYLEMRFGYPCELTARQYFFSATFYI